jgi:hypothetical protein
MTVDHQRGRGDCSTVSVGENSTWDPRGERQLSEAEMFLLDSQGQQ